MTRRSASLDIRAAEKCIQRGAREAGAAVLERFGKDGVHYVKSKRITDVVTKADLRAEKLILSGIRKAFPEHGVIAEESGAANENAECVWVVDPIDGTMNFSRGVRLFGVMICLVRRGEVILSAVNLPTTGELFFARAGRGAFLNGKRIRCSQQSSLNRSIGCTSSGVHARTGNFYRNLIASGAREHIHTSTFGAMSVNACYVACGRRDWIAAFSSAASEISPPSRSF